MVVSMQIDTQTAVAINTPAPAAGTDQALTVIDPLSRKIDIPMSIIRDTKARHRTEGTPSLCMLYLEGRCRQGASCNQIHADPPVVNEIRRAAAALPTCCQMHGDMNQTQFEEFPPWRGKSLNVDGVIISIDRVAFTRGLQRSMEGETDATGNIIVSPAFVCRLQAGGHCRYSEECKFVHLCREVTTNYLAHCVSPLATDLERKHNKTLKPSVPPVVRFPAMGGGQPILVGGVGPGGAPLQLIVPMPMQTNRAGGPIGMPQPMSIGMPGFSYAPVQPAPNYQSAMNAMWPGFQPRFEGQPQQQPMLVAVPGGQPMMLFRSM